MSAEAYVQSKGRKLKDYNIGGVNLTLGPGKDPITALIDERGNCNSRLDSVVTDYKIFQDPRDGRVFVSGTSLAYKRATE